MSRNTSSMAAVETVSPAPTCIAQRSFSASVDWNDETPVPSRPSSPFHEDAPTRVGSPVLSLHKNDPFTKKPDLQALPESLDEEWKIESKFAPEDSLEPPSPPITAADEYPEGGFRAWMTVLGGTLVIMSTFGLSNAFGTFAAEYHRNSLAEYPTSTISWIGSTHLFLTFSGSLFSGYLFDKGYFRYQLLFGSSLWIFGMFMLSLSTTYLQIFLSHGVCLGLAVGSCFGPCISCGATYFKRKRALVVGINTAGAGLGAMILPIMLSRLFEKIGFAATIRATAYLMTGLLLISNLIMRERNLPPRPPGPVLPLLSQFAREKVMWLVCLGCFGVMCGLFIPLFYIVIFSSSHSVAPTLSLYSLSIINGCAVISRIISGLLADRFGILTTIAPYSFLVSILIFVLLSATSTPSCAVFLILFGFASGGFIALMPSSFLVLSKDLSEVGMRSGVGFAFVAIAALIGSPIAGKLLALTDGGYWAPCVFGGVMSLSGSISLACARIVVKRDTDRQKV